MTQDYKILLDVPLRPDPDSGTTLAMGFEGLAEAFQQVIEHSDPQFAIGLFGGWGSGKTTLMRAIERKLDPKTCACVWFSAWRYEKEEHLIVPLLDVIREGVVAWADKNTTSRQKARKAALEVAGTIGKAIGVLMRGFSVKAKVPGVLDLSYDANKALASAENLNAMEAEARTPRSFYHASFEAMRAAFAAFTEDGAKRIVVFVDDLDRCLPEGALEVLESMKLFFDLKGFVFVVGVDRRVIEMSVEKRYREMLPPPVDGEARPEAVTGAQYLRKIFQVPYGLAPVSAAQIDEFLWSVERSAGLPANQWGEINTHVRAHLGYLVDQNGVNPREVKRYINTYTLVRKITPWLDPAMLLAQQTISFRQEWDPSWREVQLALLAYRDHFMATLRDSVTLPDSGGLLGTLSPGLDSPPQSFLRFIGQGEPGEVMVNFANTGQSIDDYIFSGEATRNPDGASVVQVFAPLGRALLALAKARAERLDSGECINELSMARSMLSSAFEGAIGRFDPTMRALDRLMTDIQDSDWDMLSQHQADLPVAYAREYADADPSQPTADPASVGGPSVAETMDDLVDRWNADIRAIMANLQELYRAGLA